VGWVCLGKVPGQILGLFCFHLRSMSYRSASSLLRKRPRRYPFSINCLLHVDLRWSWNQCVGWNHCSTATARATVEAGRDGDANSDGDDVADSGRGWAFSEAGVVASEGDLDAEFANNLDLGRHRVVWRGEEGAARICLTLLQIRCSPSDDTAADCRDAAADDVRA